MNQEEQKLWEKLHQDFMTPYVYFAKNEAEARDICGDESGLELSRGFYVRLSASGYLDCTDWTGPFETQEEAQIELINLYASDC